jgi:hypothetical protein
LHLVLHALQILGSVAILVSRLGVVVALVEAVEVAVVITVVCFASNHLQDRLALALGVVEEPPPDLTSVPIRLAWVRD